MNNLLRSTPNVEHFNSEVYLFNPYSPIRVILIKILLLGYILTFLDKVSFTIKGMTRLFGIYSLKFSLVFLLRDFLVLS